MIHFSKYKWVNSQKRHLIKSHENSRTLALLVFNRKVTKQLEKLLLVLHTKIVLLQFCQK